MFDDEEHYNTLIDCGAKGFILKESEHDEVERAIDAICSGRLYFSQELLVKLLRKKNTIRQIDLKAREREILTCLCKGLSSSEIADVVHLSSRTVEKIRSELMQKTDTTNSVGLVVFAIKNHLVDL